MLNRFMNGGGTTFSNIDLTTIIETHIKNAEFHERVLEGFNIIFSKASYNIDNINFYDSMSADELKIIVENEDTPVYGYSDVFDGLALAIHAWQAFSLDVESVSFNNNAYYVTVNFRFWDIFGLGENDIREPDYCSGFSSWYILQHKSEYQKRHRPFFTYVTYQGIMTIPKN